jgi:hypothetical protein
MTNVMSRRPDVRNAESGHSSASPGSTRHSPRGTADVTRSVRRVAPAPSADDASTPRSCSGLYRADRPVADLGCRKSLSAHSRD